MTATLVCAMRAKDYTLRPHLIEFGYHAIERSIFGDDGLYACYLYEIMNGRFEYNAGALWMEMITLEFPHMLCWRSLLASTW